MNSIRTAVWTILVLAVALAAACADSPVELGDRDPSASLLDTDLVGEAVNVLERDSPFAADEVVEKTIGPLGGTIELPEAGLVVVVPTGALAAPTTIRVVAPAGDLVGYQFSPEGLTFTVPILALQNLKLTEVAISAINPQSDLIAAYFEGDLEPSVTALEVLPFDVRGVWGLFEISHFSGYVVATN